MGAVDRFVRMLLVETVNEDKDILKRMPTDENDEKHESVLLFCKNRSNRLDRIPISAVRGSVQPVFYPALSYSWYG